MGEARRRMEDIEESRSQALLLVTAIVAKAGGEVRLGDADIIKAADSRLEVSQLPGETVIKVVPFEGVIGGH